MMLPNRMNQTEPFTFLSVVSFQNYIKWISDFDFFGSRLLISENKLTQFRRVSIVIFVYSVV